jgi:hypothetical protein
MKGVMGIYKIYIFSEFAHKKLYKSDEIDCALVQTLDLKKADLIRQVPVQSIHFRMSYFTGKPLSKNSETGE